MWHKAISVHPAAFDGLTVASRRISLTITGYKVTRTGKVLVDMDDLVFYEVVMEKREDDAYLITGNIRHFPECDFIVTPAEMMEIIHHSEYH